VRDDEIENLCKSRKENEITFPCQPQMSIFLSTVTEGTGGLELLYACNILVVFCLYQFVKILLLFRGGLW